LIRIFTGPCGSERPRPTSPFSDMVNEAVKLTLAEDAEDLAALDERKRESNLDFEQFVKALKRRGKI